MPNTRLRERCVRGEAEAGGSGRDGGARYNSGRPFASVQHDVSFHRGAGTEVGGRVLTASRERRLSYHPTRTIRQARRGPGEE